jgi:4-amino-4-deoxy-L-arabinose transferase-like glycosyltransferase
MGDRFWSRLLLIALLALTVRVGYIGIAKWHDEVEYSDALYYATQAQVLAEGGGFDHREFDRPAADHAPLTQISQAPTAVVFGRSVLAQRLVQAVYGTLAVVAVALLARKVAGDDRAGVWAGVVAAVYPNLWVNDGVILAETLTALLVALLLWSVYAYVDRPSGRQALVIGALSGLAALARAELLLLGVLAFVPVAHHAWSSWSKRAGALGLAALAGAVVLAPWMAYNAGRFDKPVIISTNDGLTLVGANCERQYDGPDPGLWDIACLPLGAFDDATQRRDQSVVNADYRHLAVEHAKENLSDLPRVAAIRVARTWSLFDPASMVRFSVNEGRESAVGWAGFVTWWLLVPVAVAGGLVLHGRRRTLWPLLAPFVVVTLISALFYGLLRFRVPAEVSLVVLVGVALAELQARRTVPA